MNEPYLFEVRADDQRSLSTLYDWARAEPHPERHTCRPVQPLADRERYLADTACRVAARALRLFLFATASGCATGKVAACDHNPRNRSAEFGYYLPPANRGRGYGTAMVRMFLQRMFGDAEWPLHKLYATTASGNAASVVC